MKRPRPAAFISSAGRHNPGSLGNDLNQIQV